MTAIEHDYAIAVFHYFHAVDEIDNRCVRRTFGVDGIGNVHCHDAARTVSSIASGILHQRAAVYLIEVVLRLAQILDLI